MKKAEEYTKLLGKSRKSPEGLKILYEDLMHNRTTCFQFCRLLHWAAIGQCKFPEESDMEMYKYTQLLHSVVLIHDDIVSGNQGLMFFIDKWRTSVDSVK